MSDLFPLSDLADPLSFLTGARIPLCDPSSRRTWHFIVSQLWYEIESSMERGDADFDEELDDWRPSRRALARLSIDLADPDVARWVDRKIAEVIVARAASMSRTYAPIVAAALGHQRKAWVIRAMHDDGCSYSWGIFGAEREHLALIPCDAAHIPQARAALLWALYGRTDALPR